MSDHGPHVQQRSIVPLILRHPLNSPLLDVELSRQPLQFRISGASILEGLSGYGACVVGKSSSSYGILLDVVVGMFERHGEIKVDFEDLETGRFVGCSGA